MATAPATAPLPSTSDKGEGAKHRIQLRRASLYLLEGVLQNPGPCTTPIKLARWAKAWEKVRRANNRVVQIENESYDIEKGVLRRERETDLQWAYRSRAYTDAKERWDREVVTLTINDKLRDVCREAVEWFHEHRDDPKVGARLGGEFAAELMIALGLTDAVPDDEFAADVE